MISTLIDFVNKRHNKNPINFSAGDTLKVNVKITENNKTRIQAFTGVVLKIQGHGANKSMTLRKESTHGVMIERVLPINSPLIASWEIVKKGKVRRARLYYLRNLKGKAALVKKNEAWTNEHFINNNSAAEAETNQEMSSDDACPIDFNSDSKEQNSESTETTKQ